MNRRFLASAVGTLALVANVLFPGMAFGQDTDQAADVSVGCGVLTVTVDNNNNFQMKLPNGSSPTVSTSAQNVYGKSTGASYAVTYQNGTSVLPNETFISVNDSRNIGVGVGCATDGTDEGWLLQVSSTNFSDGGSNTIDASNFYVVTTTNVTPDGGFTENAGAGDGADDNVFYLTGYSGTKNIVAQYNLADTEDMTTASPFTGQGAALDSSRDVLDNATGAGTDDFKFVKVGIGLAYMLVIPAETPGGTYTATVDIDLITST